jgi:cytoskeletal protein CcmA (bactofilin family)
MGAPFKRDHRQPGAMTMGIRLFGAVALAFVVALATTGSASAAEVKRGDTITVRAGQTIRGDLYAFGQDITIAGTINGDLIGAGRNVTISGTVNGAVNMAAEKITISGVVTSSARVAGETITISGSIGGDLVVGGKTARITSAGKVQGDVLVGSGDLTVAGPVGRDIRGSAGNLVIQSRVGRDVRVAADSVRLTPQGRIGGDLRYASDDPATIASGARISGQTERTSKYRFSGGPDALSAMASHIARLLLMLVTGLLLVLFLPRPAIAAAEAIRVRLPVSALSGLLTLILWPILAVLLLIVVVGIPLALIGTAMLLCVAYLSQVFVGLAIGRIILPESWRIRSRGYNILAMAIGVILIGVVRMIPVPVISPLVALIVAILGVGGVLTALRSARTPEVAM